MAQPCGHGLLLISCVSQLRTVLYALRLNDSTFGIFDTFEDEAGLDAHLNGQVAAALIARADDLFAEAPDIRKVRVIADKE